MPSYNKSEIYIVDADEAYHYGCYSGAIEEERIKMLPDIDDDQILTCDKCGKVISR